MFSIAPVSVQLTPSIIFYSTCNVIDKLHY
jgi:hypothetical protein